MSINVAQIGLTYFGFHHTETALSRLARSTVDGYFLQVFLEYYLLYSFLLQMAVNLESSS